MTEFKSFKFFIVFNFLSSITSVSISLLRSNPDKTTSGEDKNKPRYPLKLTGLLWVFLISLHNMNDSILKV